MIHELLWRITYSCDKNCSFCFNNAFEDKVDYGAVESTDLDRVLRFVHTHGIEKVYLSGGEPAMSPMLTEAVRQLATAAKVTVFTNGLLLKRYSPEEIAKLPISAINISIPLEDIQTGSAWFWSLLEKVELLRSHNAGIRLNTQLMLTPDFFRLCAHPNFQLLCEKLDRIFWQPLTVPIDHPLYEKTIESLPSEEVARILAAVEKSSNSEMPEHVKCIRHVLERQTCVTCQMGKDYVTLNPDLTVSLCPHKNDLTIPMEQFSQTTAQPCNELSMRCVCLYSHLKRRYP